MKALSAMNVRQRHRGPDDQGAVLSRDKRLGLAMSRLAIIDIDGGRQPMVSEDRRFAMVFNGEIFNALDLRRAHFAEDEVFESGRSDTETLFKLLQKHGADCLPWLNGMFAFAFHDAEKQTVLCARDRFGIKPLHYVHQSGRFAFASEIKSLLALPFVSRELDPQAAFDYLSLMFIPGGGSVFRDIRRVPPGHFLVYDTGSGDVALTRWWRFKYQPDDHVRPSDWPHMIAAELQAAVKRWCWSDVPVAVSLSGGLDSSAVAGYAARNGTDLMAVSLGFSGPENAPLDELPLARLAAEKWGLRHEEIILRPDALLDELEAMVDSLDEPYGGGLPSWFVFKVMGEKVKVGLTGTGGDEMFGNYAKWSPLEGRRLRRLMPRRKHQIGKALFQKSFFEASYYWPDSEKREVLAQSAKPWRDTNDLLFDGLSDGSTASVRDAASLVDIETQLPDEFLLMTDRFSMAHSLEARTPFLDNGLTDLVSRIPSDIRTNPFNIKGLLRQAAAPVLPKALINAPKRGFVIPQGAWLRGELRSLVERVTADSFLKRQGVFTSALQARIVTPHLDGSADHSKKLWAVLMFQLWWERRAAS